MDTQSSEHKLFVLAISLSVKFIMAAFNRSRGAVGWTTISRKNILVCFVYLWRSHSWVCEFTNMILNVTVEYVFRGWILIIVQMFGDGIRRVIWHWNSAFYIFWHFLCEPSSPSHLLILALSFEIWIFIIKTTWFSVLTLCSKSFASFLTNIVFWILLDN